MNFVAYSKDIENKLFKKDRFGGCYVYSRDKDDDTFKLGMSEVNLFGRVKGAKSCYPYKSEFWIHMFIVCHDKSSVRTLENKLLAESQHLKKVDVEKPEEEEQGNRPREYRIAATRANLNSAVENVLNENKKVWDMLVVFGPQGWLIKHNNGANVSVTGPTTSKKMTSIEPSAELKLGDMAYVIYTETEKGKPIISKRGKITQKLKFTFRVHWDDWKGKPFWGKYPFNEVYKLKKQAESAKKYWYEKLV